MNRYIQEHKEVRFFTLVHGLSMGKVFKPIKMEKLKIQERGVGRIFDGVISLSRPR